MITIDEIKKFYRDFPITVGFRKYIPVDQNHEVFLEAIGTSDRGRFIVGDFIAGNWRKPRCAMLGDDNLCRLHKEGGKPAQCSLVPFCAIYPEERQDAVFKEQRKGAFSRCKGYRAADETSCEVWKNGKFTNQRYAAAFAEFRGGLLRQKPFMMKMLKDLKKQAAFSNFLKGSGILEVAVPGDMLLDLFQTAGIPEEDRGGFISRQKELCSLELQASETRIEVFRDWIVACEVMLNRS